MEPHQEAKLDRILEGLAELKPQVADTKADVHHLRSSVKRLEIQSARHDERLANTENDLNKVGEKVRSHIGNAMIHENTVDNLTSATVRWKFVAAASGAIVGLAGILTAFKEWATSK
jgi:chromosome segregation ATPase